jgi:hypothetical protein
VRVHLTLQPEEVWLGVMDAAAEVRPTMRRGVTSLEEVDAADSEQFGGWGLHLAR